LLFFLFLAFNKGWMGGADFGFRYIIPVLPFLCIGSAAWMSEGRLTALSAVLVVASIAICGFGAITDPHVLTRGGIPLLNYNIPHFLEHGTENVINWFLYKVFGMHIWPLRLATTAVFLGGIALLTRGHLWIRKRAPNHHRKLIS
jgi:hypothetical protein